MTIVKILDRVVAGLFALAVIILVGAAAFRCESMPETNLGRCFWMGKSTTLFGSETKDTAYIGACARYHRDEWIEKNCKLPKFKGDPKCGNLTDRAKYIETGAY